MCCVWNASSSRSSRWAGLLGRKAAGEEAVAFGAGDGEYSVELFAADLVDGARAVVVTPSFHFGAQAGIGSASMNADKTSSTRTGLEPLAARRALRAAASSGRWLSAFIAFVGGQYFRIEEFT